MKAWIAPLEPAAPGKVLKAHRMQTFQGRSNCDFILIHFTASHLKVISYLEFIEGAGKEPWC